MWRHAWRKNWVNCALLTGNSAGLRTVLSSRLSHTEFAQFTQGIPQFPQFTCPHQDGIISRHIRFYQFIQQMNIAWYIPFQIPLLLHILRFLFFFSDNIMADVASKQNDSLVFIHHSHTYKKTHRTDKKKKPDKPDGKPVLCQRTFNSVFRAVFFYTVKLHSLT